MTALINEGVTVVSCASMQKGGVTFVAQSHWLVPVSLRPCAAYVSARSVAQLRSVDHKLAARWARVLKRRPLSRWADEPSCVLPAVSISISEECGGMSRRCESGALDLRSVFQKKNQYRLGRISWMLIAHSV